MNDYEPVAPTLHKQPPKVDTTATTYFWGAVAAVVFLGLMVFLVFYGLSQGEPAPADGSAPDGAPAVMRQLPLYLGSAQYQDPPESA
jgi:hypothetical protein